MARVYAIASAKGGVGKTTTTANLGATLAGTGADVVVIDGDIGMANLGAALGVRPDGATLHDVLGGTAEPVAAGYEGPNSLTVIPGDTSLEAFSAAEPQRLGEVVDAFEDADYILIDVGAGVSHETSVPLSLADAVVLVSTPERDALVDTEKTRQLTERLGGIVAGAVITRTDDATPIEEVVGGSLTAEVLTTIPEDEAVRESIAVGEPLSSYAPYSGAATAYRKLAAKLTGTDPTPPAEPSTVDLDDDTRTAIEERGDQLADSLSETGITMNPGTDAGDDPTADESDDHASEAHPEGAESKWAEAATGSVGDSDLKTDETDSQTVDTVEESTLIDGPTDNTDAETDPDSTADPDNDPLTEDAIPFQNNQSAGGESTNTKPADEELAVEDATDEESTETTVLGDAVEETRVDETDEDNSLADEPLIPDAEETAAATTETADDTVEDDVDDIKNEKEDKKEKRGFFSRLFR
jgi:septum site-determining protein MinD